MGVSVNETPSAEVAASAESARSSFPRWFQDSHGGIAAALYVVLIAIFEHKAIGHLGSTCACESAVDPTQWMWSWAWFAHALLHAENPLYTDEIWTGSHYNLAATTLAPITAIPGVPLEALFGPVVAYNLLTLAAPVVNGWAAYRLCRYMSGAPWPSVLAGYTYGFSAYYLDQSNGHLHLLYVFAAPLLVLEVLRFLNAEISARRLALFGAVLLTVQFGLSPEVLFDMSFLGALAWIFGFLFAPGYRGRLIKAAVALIVAYLVMGVICAYYVYVETRVPSYAKNNGLLYPGDLLSYFIPTDVFRIGGHAFASISGGFNTSDTSEQNEYLGLPLCLIVLAYGFSSWRSRGTKIVILTTACAFVVSLGTPLVVGGHDTFSLPFAHLVKLPGFDLVLPTRFGAFVSLGAAVCAACWIPQAIDRRGQIWRWVVGLAAVAFLWPNLGYYQRTGPFVAPTFFTQAATYKRYVTKGEVVLTIPFTNTGFDMLWQADTHLWFKLAGGYFGAVPPVEGVYPTVDELSAIPAVPLTTGSAADLDAYTQTKHVGVILVQDGQAGGWPIVLAHAGWRRTADTGGMSVYHR